MSIVDRRRHLMVPAFLGLLAVFLLALAAPAAAISTTGGTVSEDGWVTLNGNVNVAEGDLVKGLVLNVNGNIRIAGTVEGDVLLFSGNVDVLGEVTGAVTVVSGNALVSGTVGDSVVVFDGNATVLPTGSVGSDVRAGGNAVVLPGGQVAGDVGRVRLGTVFGVSAVLATLGLWVTFGISTLLVGLAFVLLLPRIARRTSDEATAAPWPVLGWGAVLGIALPVVAGIALGSFVAFPLGAWIFLALALLGALGYVVGAAALGRRVVPKAGEVGQFATGWAILLAVALLPVLGLLAIAVTSLVGLGAAAMVLWRSGHDQPATTATAAATTGAPLPPPRVPTPV